MAGRVQWSAWRNLDHKTAAVIIPPEDVWPAIQAIRQKHDSKVGRWAPYS